jgi:hypothetical protein
MRRATDLVVRVSLTKRRQSCLMFASARQSTSGTAEIASPTLPPELRFFDDFLQQEKDYHLLMLAEAHRKHGVNMFVPPQLPPNGAPPEVPDVIFCDAQTQRLRSIKLAYAPTHGPPPLETTGNRELPADMVATVAATAPSISKSSPEGKVVKTIRMPVEEDKKFHCSVCGKPFRVLLAAEHHVRTEHLENATSPSVLDGPGPGELVEKEVPSETTAVPTDPVPELKPLVDNRKATLTLPTADEVDILLREVWDPFGLAKDPKFATAGSVVLGIADDRKPLTEEDMKPSARATPAGAAPGIKKAVSLGSSKPGLFKSIKELSARFPNPFGQSAHLAELEAIENEPKNPFLNLDPSVDPQSALHALRTGPGSPSLAHAAATRRFACPACPKAFRILDALIDHHEETHGGSLADEVMVAMREMEKRSILCKPADVETSRHALALKKSSMDAAATPPAPVVEADVGVHFRAHSNAVVQGQVTEIQRGFLKSVAVTQLVVKAVGASQDEEDEYVVVRCVGDSFALLVSEQVKVGTTVLTNGSLRMNRRLDAVSKRTHAYPYIVVSPPLGSVHVVDG